MPDVAENNKALLRRFMEEVANQGNLAVIDELMVPNFVEHEEFPPGTPTGREAVRFFFSQWRQGFPDGRVQAELEIAEGDLVVGYETWSGTHTGEFFGMLASGKSVTFKAIDIVRIADGKLVEHWGILDHLTLRQQIGVLPASE